MKLPFSKKTISTDALKIEEILNRSVDKVYPSKDDLKKVLLSGKRITIYVGIDPTADYVHMGHSTNYLILERFHKLGHRIIVLVGDFTAMIGDPTDKTSARVQLSKEQIKKNLTSFKKQIGKILDFNDRSNPIDFKFNSKWLSKLSFEQLIDISSNFTVQQMIERDMFQKRLSEKKPLYVHEFFYPLMQGYDSVALGVDIEMGGTDQTFNMLAGRTLVKRYLNKEKFVISTTLLTNPVTGEKLMSKSLGTGVGLNESSDSMFGKIMALADEGVVQTFIDCTRLTMEEIQKKKDRLANGVNPKEIKLELACEVVRMYHGEVAANKAMANWENTFSKGNNPDEVETVLVEDGEMVASVLIRAGLVASKSEWRRLVEQGGIHNTTSDDLVIKDEKEIIKDGMTIRVGKRKFVKIQVKK